MEDIQEAYPLLLGRPWLRQAKAKHNWETDVLAIRQGKRKIKLAVQARTKVAPANRPTHAEGIYLTDGLDDDEEERYLGANQTVVGLFEIDVEALLQKHEKPVPEAVNPKAEDKAEEKPVRQSKAKRTQLEMDKWAQEKLMPIGEAAETVTESNPAEEPPDQGNQPE